MTLHSSSMRMEVWMPWIVVAGASFFLCIVGYAAWRVWDYGKEFREQGITTRALILKKFTRDGSSFVGKLENKYIQCSFQESKGKERIIDIVVSSKVYHSLKEGEVIEMSYLPEDPQKATYGSVSRLKLTNTLFLAFAGFFFCIGLGLIITVLKETIWMK